MSNLINNSVHKTTNEPPSKLLFGVKQRGKLVDAIQEYVETHVNTNDRDLIRFRERAADK